jgi:hypothetical protein
VPHPSAACRCAKHVVLSGKPQFLPLGHILGPLANSLTGWPEKSTNNFSQARKYCEVSIATFKYFSAKQRNS